MVFWAGFTVESTSENVLISPLKYLRSCESHDSSYRIFFYILGYWSKKFGSFQSVQDIG